MKKFYSLFLLLLTCSIVVQAQTTITVNPATTYQTIRGFGGSGNTNSGYDKYLTYMVDVMGLTVFRQYFDGGASGSITKAQIDAGTFNFTDNAASANFHKALKAKGVTTIIATSWSPPASLKQNNCLCQKYQGLDANCCQGSSACGSYNCADANNYLLAANYSSYGKFLAAWVKDFESKSTQKVYALNIQNEPNFNEPYSSAILTSTTFGPCLQAVHTEFTNAGLTTMFHGPEHMGSYAMNTSGVTDYIGGLLNNGTYGPLLDIYSVHSYTDGINVDLGDAPSWTSLYNAVSAKGKELWMTETDFGGTADWSMAFDMARQIYAALKFGKVSAWLYWSMDASNGFYNAGFPLIRLFPVMQYARFVRPGYKQIQVTEGDGDVAAIGFKNPANNDITIVALNLSTTATKTITFNSFTNKPSYFHMYRSSANENCSYVGKFTNNSFTLPPKSVATLYFKESEPDVVFGPTAPVITATNVGDNTITVTWNKPASYTLGGTTVNVKNYHVFLNGVKKTSNGSITTNTYTFTGLKAGTKYNIQVIAYDDLALATTPASLDVVTTSGGVIVPPPPDELLTATDNFSVSPNPASNYIKVKTENDVLSVITIVDVTGNMVIEKQATSSEEMVDVSRLPKGIYFVIAKGMEKVHKAKIIIE